MPAISGLLSLSNGTSTNEWVSEYQEAILVRNSKGIGNGATLFGLMSRLPNEPAETTEYSWFERDPVTRQVFAAAAATNVATTISVDDGAAGNVTGLIQVGTILRTINGELMRVTAVAAFGSGKIDLTVTRNFGTGGPTPAAIADNDLIAIITLGKDEGADPINAVYETVGTLRNYVQTFNSAVHLTNAMKGSKMRTDLEGPLRDRRVQALERVSRDIELAYLLGRASRVTGANGYAYYTGGLIDSVDQISASPAQKLNGLAGTGVALSVFQTWLSSFLTVGSEAKIAFCGPGSYSAISTFANSATNGFRITGQENVFGMNITEINTPFGSLSLTMHPLFKEMSLYNNLMVVADLGLLAQKVMEPLFLEPNIQAIGSDSYREQFRAKLGLKLKFANAFGYAYDLQKIN